MATQALSSLDNSMTIPETSGSGDSPAGSPSSFGPVFLCYAPSLHSGNENVYLVPVYIGSVYFFFFVQGLILKGLLEFRKRPYLTLVSRVGTTEDCGGGWLTFAET